MSTGRALHQEGELDLKPEVGCSWGGGIEQGGGRQGQNPGGILWVLGLPGCQVQQQVGLGCCRWHSRNQCLCKTVQSGPDGDHAGGGEGGGCSITLYLLTQQPL